MRKRMETAVTQAKIGEWLGQGKSRQYIMAQLQELGLTPDYARVLFYDTLKSMAPDPNLLDDYKRTLVQVNLDRLERIIDDCIAGNVGEKTVALKAIAELNKMLGLGGNNVTIAQKDKDGDEQVIKISFES